MTRVALIALAVLAVASIQATSGFELAVPVFRQPLAPADKIVGGQEAKPGQFPHQAGVTINGAAFCGGSLISRTFVLTAGHCIYNFNTWAVTLGAHAIRDANEPGRITLASTTAVRHEQYTPSTITNDVGVITLPRAVDLGARINTIPLPPKSLQKENLAGKIARVSGWGRTSDSSSGISPVLRFVDLPLISTDECRAVYGSVITNTKYCCSGANSRSTCNGDSGGSLTLGSGDNFTHIGIVSFGSARGCSRGFPVGFTATTFFVDWISQKTGIPVRP